MRRPAPGDEAHAAGFSALFAEHFADIWRFVRRRTASSEDADDVSAEVFATAWRRKDDLPPDDERRLWLFGVARLVLANHHRSLLRRQRLERRITLYRPPISADGVGPRNDDLWQALAALGDNDRDLLLMRAWDGLAVTEIASLLGCSANAVSVRLHKARRRLAKQLAGTDLRRDGHVEYDPAPEQGGRL